MEISRFEYGYYRESRMQNYHLEGFCKREGVDKDYLSCQVERYHRKNGLCRIINLLVSKFSVSNKTVKTDSLQPDTDGTYLKKIV
ncbi:hypothetical protein SpiGrapes_0225 [Sphaerochaeta pleomorpha str. Grapes]|uniref:Uncharacterized protein n=1 Tax=Sphaerochaeta pleomorpha (strain ATCC BAA-1885 / DSM 22778 / Grapes) TaxID=158190 RepID=G8QUB8_SPHPG|nr:hypothetical protein [Sphaerochaeta pleomorpha]AEV28088.1 hypothetical protein SpiGrapes_0225 [Sphaerochaeta pleomorpha str. Grapes]